MALYTEQVERSNTKTNSPLAAQFVGQDFEDAGIAPAGPLLIACGPGRHIMRQIAPYAAGAHQVAQGIRQFTQWLLLLPAYLRTSSQYGSNIDCSLAVTLLG